MMGLNGTEFKTNQITIIDPDTDLPIFSTTKFKYNLDKSTRNLEASVVHAAEVVSPVDRKLQLQAQNIFVRGIEGTSIDGKEILISAESGLFLKSSNGSIKMMSQNGIYIDIDRIPVAREEKDIHGKSDLLYKLCICLPKGNIYRVSLSSAHASDFKTDLCRHFNRSVFDPCL